MWWTVFLYTFTKFNIGNIYVSNVFYGCIIYYLTKLAFKKEHIDFFIKMVLWVLALNLAYAVVQVFGGEFIYGKLDTPSGDLVSRESITIFGKLFRGRAPFGFMGNTSVLAIFIAMCVPLLVSRGRWWAYTWAGLLLVPLYLLHSSMGMVASLIGALFVLWFRMPRKIWIISAVVLSLLGGAFLWKVDMPGLERIHAWKLMARDCTIHPITGWGLDSFRNITEKKKHVYALNAVKMGKESYAVDKWDKPHNIYISLLFEFGIVGLFLLGGYLRQISIWFNRAVKSSDVLALAGFILVFFIVSIGHFPIFLARLSVFIICVFALLELKIRP